MTSRSLTGPGVSDRETVCVTSTPPLVSGRNIRDLAPPKACRHCGETKPAPAFPLNPRMRDGLGSWCKPCHLVRTQQWRREHRERINASRRAQYAAEHGEVRPYARRKWSLEPVHTARKVGRGPGTGDKSTIVTPAPSGEDK